MFFLPYAITAEEARAERAYQQRRTDALRKDPVPWDPNMKFEASLHIKASTYKMPSLFDVEPTPACQSNPNRSTNPKQHAISPCGNWLYRERIIEAGQSLQTKSGRRNGVVMWDGPVKIPIIHKTWPGSSSFDTDPWMSFTPMEFFTLRPGTRLARGHTIVAGLGLGHQLVEVCKKRSVKKVTLIEIDQGIVDWILPRLDLNGKEVEVVIGDADKLIYDMEADVALMDIYPSYGGNGHRIRADHSRGKMPGIGKLWVWGAA